MTFCFASIKQLEIHCLQFYIFKPTLCYFLFLTVNFLDNYSALDSIISNKYDTFLMQHNDYIGTWS